jgi:sorting nexin-25
VGGRKQSTSLSLSIGYNLKDILTNTAGLSYFMEFMDRRGDMVKLQFWLMVEGFNITTDISQDQQRGTFLQDVKMMYEMYFTETAPHRLHIAEQLVKDLKNTIQLASSCTEEAAFANHIRELRLRLIRIQQHVFWEIEKEHYPYFKRSDLYFKFLSSAPPATSNIMTSTNTLDEVEQVHTRRSLDESTLYQSSSPSKITNRPASIHSTHTVINSPSSVNDSSASLYPKPRGHQRALSDSTTKSSSRFLSFSNMFASNRRLWQSTEPIESQQGSISASIQSLEEEDDEDEYTQQQQPEELDTQITAKRNRLIRSNTVDAVEAELRSILDGNVLEEMAPLTNKEQVEEQDIIKKPTSLPASSSSPLLAPPQLLLKPSSSSSALMLCGSRGMKSTTAVPVQNAYPLPSWTSSGGTNAISEIEHDSLESVLPSNKSNSSSITNTTSSKPMANMPSTLESQLTVEDETINNVHFAPPGDLMLAAKVQQLSEEVEKLTAHEAIVDALIIKAESQQKLEELRILKKSKTMFRQELQQILYQKSQYELQASENVLMPQRSQVTITSATIGNDKHGDFALYVIEIQQLGVDGNYASGWIVARRYSEFFALHQKLKEQFPAVRLMEFPSKWPSSFLKLQKHFVETRRLSLERYLRKLIQDKEICQSQTFRSFLSQQNIFVPGPDTEWPFVGGLFGNGAALQTSSSSSSLHSLTSPSIQNLQKSIAAVSAEDNTLLQKKPSKGFMRHIYKTVAAGIDDILIGPSMLDLITQRLGEQVMDFSIEDSTSSNSARSKDASNHADFTATANANANANTASTTASTPELPDALKAEGITRFTEPLCDLFIEMFELKDKTNWLRRQAVVIILQQILEGTIERYRSFNPNNVL